MSTPSSSEPPNDEVDLGKGSESDVPFDPYRFGHPDVPPAPEYAPPGYIPPPGLNSPPPRPVAAPPGTAVPGYGPSSPSGYGIAPGQPGGGYPGYPPPPGYGPLPGYAPPPGYGQQPSDSNGKAVASLVLGIVSIVLCWTLYFDVVLVILSVVFGFLGLDEAKRHGHGRGMAIAGLVCGVLGALAAIALTVLVVHLANKCGGLDNGNAPGFQRCVRNQL